MRTLIAAAAVLFAVGTTSPVMAASPAPPTLATSSIVQGLPVAGTAVLASTKKKSKKKKSSSKESASFEEIGNAKRGESDLEIKVKVSKSNRTCELKIKWKNGDTSNDDAKSNDDKICELSISVPDARDASGDASATVDVKDSSGKKVATAKTTFPVK